MGKVTFLGMGGGDLIVKWGRDIGAGPCMNCNIPQIVLIDYFNYYICAFLHCLLVTPYCNTIYSVIPTAAKENHCLLKISWTTVRK